MRERMRQFKTALVLIHVENSESKYFNVRDLKHTWNALYRALRHEYVNESNEMGCVFQSVVKVYFERNFDLHAPLKRHMRKKIKGENVISLAANRANQAIYLKAIDKFDSDYDSKIHIA